MLRKSTLDSLTLGDIFYFYDCSGKLTVNFRMLIEHDFINECVYTFFNNRILRYPRER